MRTSSRPPLYLTDIGAGPPVLVITGWTISSAIFDTMGQRFVPHVRVIAYDHRGTGRSARWYGPMSVASLAADAARVLDDRRLVSAHIIGLSLGAAVAIELAIRMPSRVRTLCLIGGGTGGPRSAMPRPGDAARAASALAKDSVRHRELWPAAALFSEKFRREQPSRVEELTKPFTLHRAPAWAVGWQAMAAACFGRRSALRSITAPTLILHGGRDVMTPAENARRIAAAIPNSRLHIFPEAGHAAPLEHPEEAAQLILGWIARHGERIPPPDTPRDQLVERLTRPLALPAGAAANTADGLRGVISALLQPRNTTTMKEDKHAHARRS